MKHLRSSVLITLVVILAPATPARSADEPSYTRQQEVIYGRKDGTALTLDVLTPSRHANGAAVVMVVSGGFFSAHEAINLAFARPLVDRGYTVFAVVHGSQPRDTVPEIVQDIQRALRFIRHHAEDYRIDPGRIGITGASAGGHLALMQGTAGDQGNPQAKDPVDRASGRVQAVACFLPSTDFLNYGRPGRELVRPTDHDPPFRAAFDYRELDQDSMLWVSVTDFERLREITRAISPIAHVSPDDPPTLILHGGYRRAGATPAVRGDGRGAPGGRRRGGAGRQGGGRARLAGDGPGHGAIRRLVRRPPEGARLLSESPAR